MLRSQLHIETLKWFSPVMDYVVCGDVLLKVK